MTEGGRDTRTALLQATVATTDLAATSALLRRTLGAAPGFGDPELESWGIADEILTLGATYLEVVAPLRPGSELDRFLSQGDGGYLLAIRVPDAAALAARCERMGVTISHRQELNGAVITQLHPRHLGVLVEADQIPAGRHWHYDAEPAAATRPARAADIVAAHVAVADPADSVRTWSELFDVPAADATSVRLGEAVVHFEPITTRKGLVGLDLAAGGEPVHGPFTVAGTTMRLLPAAAPAATAAPA